MSAKPLAYVSVVKSLEPIEGKDRIELAKFENHEWQVIVQKGQFALGDKAMYIETGSVLPLRDEFKFLESRCFSAKYGGYKIKTIKMGGVYSEGIAFRLETLGVSADSPADRDFTKDLEIKRVEDEPLPAEVVEKTWWQKLLSKIFGIELGAQGFVKGGFPDYLAKTDETQAASIPGLFESMAGKSVGVTLKLDGQSVTCAVHDGAFTISTRNQLVYKNTVKKALRDIREEKARMYKAACPPAYAAARLNMPAALAGHKSLAVQGELCGPRVQGNKMGLGELNFFAFNVFSIAERRYYSLGETAKFCEARGIPAVPLLERRVFDFKDMGELQAYANAFDYENGSPAEGIVIRGEDGSPWTPEPVLGKMHGMLSFKVVSQRFKIKHQEDE